MSVNPFQSPTTHGPGKPVDFPIEYREFSEKTFLGFVFSYDKYRNRIRDEVQRAIASEIGVENVISISEYTGARSPFSVVVWYKKEMPRQSLSLNE